MSETTCECGRTGAHTCNGLGEKGYQSIDPDSAEERVLRHAQLIHEACGCDGCPVHPEDVAGARAAIAVADEEQARLKWLVRHHADIYAGACEDASRAEAEVERLTRECLDREATETDARERLRQAEATLTLAATHHVRRVWVERRGEVSWSCACGHVMKHQQMKDGYALIPMCPDDPRAAQAYAETFRD